MEPPRLFVARPVCLWQSCDSHGSRIPVNGKPRLYGGWLGETLNMMLRSCGTYAHRLTLEVRVFTLFDLQGRLGLTKEVFGAEVAAGCPLGE